MFKQTFFVCIFISISLEVRANTSSDIEILLTELTQELTEKVKTFNENLIKRQQEVFDAVPQFEKDEEMKMTEEFNRIHEEMASLEQTKPECLHDTNIDIAHLSFAGKPFYTCSSQIYGSAERNFGIFQTQVMYLEFRTDSFKHRLLACGDSENCLKALLDDLIADTKELPGQVEKYTKDVKQMSELKKNELKKCSKIDVLKRKAIEFINKIKNCTDVVELL